MSISYTQSVNESRKGSALTLNLLQMMEEPISSYFLSVYTSRDPSEEGFTALPPNLTFFVSLEFNLAFRLSGAVR